MEIWNVRWAVSQPGANQQDIDAWEASKGEPVSPIYRKGAQYQGIGGNAQSLKLYEALLSRGYHVAVLGGSDRHIVFAEGFPATWVRVSDNSVDGVKAGIAANVALLRDGDYSLLIGAMVPYVDDMSFMTPDKCDPADCEADMAQCMLPDDNGMATIFTPDWIDRVLNVIVQDGVSSTEWTMGAAGSAVLFGSTPI